MVFRSVKQKKRLIFRTFSIFLGIWIFFLALLPFALSKGILAKQLGKQLHGNVTFGKVYLSWFGRQKIENFNLKDGHGQSILYIKSIRSNSSLFSLIFDKLNFKETYIEGLEGNISTPNAQFSHLNPTLKETHLVTKDEKKKRPHPVFIIKKPIAGNFHINNSNFVIHSTNNEPIYFTDVQLSLSAPKGQRSVVAYLSCETSKSSLSGNIDLKLEIGGFNDKNQLTFAPFDSEVFFLTPQGYINLNAEITNLPSESIDHLFNLYNPKYGQIFSNAAGGPLNLGATIYSVNDNSKVHLSLHAHDLDLQFAGSIKQNIFSLTDPSICRLNIRPALMTHVVKAFSNDSNLTIDQPTIAEIQFERLITPLNFNSFNLNNLSCNAKLSLSPMKFTGDKEFSHFEIKYVKGTLDTFDLNENLTLHFNALAHDNNLPVYLKVDGEFTKLLQNHGIDQIRSHIMAQAKDIPTKLAQLFIKNDGYISEFVGPTINIDGTFKGSLKAADITMNMASSRISIPNFTLKLQDNHLLTLIKPVQIEIRATPALAKKVLSTQISMLQPCMLKGNLDACELFFHNKEYKVKTFDLKLNSNPFDFVYSDFKPFHISQTNAHFYANNYSGIKASLNTHIALPKDLPFYQLDKEVDANFQLENIFSYLKGEPSLLKSELTAYNWSATCNGYIDKVWNYELLEEASFTFNSPSFKWGTDYSVQTPNQVLVSINPCSFNPFNLRLNKLNVNGEIFAKQLTIANKNVEHTFKEMNIPFEYSGTANYFKCLSNTSNPVINLSLRADSIIQSDYVDFKEANYQLTMDFKKLPTKLLNILSSKIYDYEAMMGPLLDATFTSNFRARDILTGNIEYEVLTSILKSQGAFSFGEKIQTNENNFMLDYLMSPQSYSSITQMFTKDDDNSLKLIEPLHIKLKMNNFTKSILSNGKQAHIAFDGSFVLDKFMTNKGAFFDVMGSFNTSNLANNLKLAFTAKTNNPETKEGIAYLAAELTNPFNLETQTLNSKINGYFNCKLSHFPTLIARDLLNYKSKELAIITDLLGPSFDMNCTAALTSGVGPIDFQIQSKKINSSFSLKLEQDHLSLIDDLKASVTLNENQMKYWLKKIYPVFISSNVNDILVNIRLSKNNFNLPIAPFDIQKLHIESAALDVGKLTLRKDTHIDRLLKLLKSSSATEDAEVWFTPTAFSVSKGLIKTQRTDFLINHQYQVAFWGEYNLKRDQGCFYLGIPPNTLKQAFGFKKLPEHYLFQIPMTGSIDHLRVDWPTAIAQLGLLGLSSQAGETDSESFIAPYAKLDQVLEVFAKTQPSGSVPQNPFPLPWKSSDIKIPDEQKVEMKACSSNRSHSDEQTQILQDFFKKLRETLKK